MSFISTVKFITNHPLNKNKKLYSLFRFFKWQFLSRVIRSDKVYHWVNGAKFYVKAHETGLTQNMYCGLQEFEDMAYILHVLRKNDLFVDVGANVGSYTILACASVCANGICIEPIPATFSRLKNNIKLNDIESRVECFNMGVADKEGEIRFTSGFDTMNHIVSNNEEELNSIVVDVKTLDSVLTQCAVNVMKIDVEGFELPVLMGAEKVLNDESLHSIIIELNNSADRYGYDESVIIDKLNSHGFLAYEYEPRLRKLTPLEGKNKNSLNTLFIRDITLVKQRVSTALTFNVLGEDI